jgi:adenylate cyclase class 2
MSAQPGNREVEVKLAAASAEDALERLARAGFQVLQPRAFEANVVFDTPSAQLRNSGRLLRLREFAGENTLTFKGPPAPGIHKSREEIETKVGSAEEFMQVLDRLGFSPTFRYEKFRTVFERPGEPGLAVLDETPIGVFLELEGAPEWIDATAVRIGYSVDDYITASYGSLYFQNCSQRGEPATNMVFSPGRENH